MMTAEERSQRMRELGSMGGRATVARHGAGHMARIGKRGFAVTKARYGGELLAKLLAASYEAKYGRPIDLTTARNRAAERERAATRRAYQDPGACQSCGGAGQERHHVRGIGAGHGDGLILWLCRACHRDIHRELRRRRLAPGELPELPGWGPQRADD